MPFVRIDLFEGRTLEQKKALAKEVTEAVVRNTGAPKQKCLGFFKLQVASIEEIA